MTHDNRSVDSFDELAVFRAVDVRGEAELLHGASSGDHDLLAFPACSSPRPAGTTSAATSRGHDCVYRLGLLHDLLGHGALDRVAGDNDAIAIVRRPPLEQLATDAILHHAWAREHHATADVVEAVEALQATDVRKVPRTAAATAAAAAAAGAAAFGVLGLGDTLAEHTFDVVVHGADVSLIDDHALACEV